LLEERRGGPRKRGQPHPWLKIENPLAPAMESTIHFRAGAQGRYRQKAM
jgi:hypothetical protein